MTLSTSHFVVATCVLLSSVVKGDVIISEVADKGSSGVCGGNDWVELFNTGDTVLDLGLEGYVLHDDKGLDSNQTFTFPGNSTIAPKAYMLLCTNQNIESEDGTAHVDLMSPSFGISGDDTVYLTHLRRANSNATGFSLSMARNGDVYEIVSTVPLPNTHRSFDVSYALDLTTRTYNYTSTPTPGAPNVFSRVLTEEERNAQLKQQLAAQNALGTTFFNMDDRGYPVADAMDAVLDLNFTMDEADYQFMIANKTWEQYKPFTSAVLSKTDGTEIRRLKEPGQIRPKGQSSLYLAACMGSPTFPFQVETAKNESLFGVERLFLRHHMGDYSYMRDYAYNRMLARFGLPFVRARKVRVTINGNSHGLYTLMEAPDQDYVFHRSFPDFNPQQYALFKIKSFAIDCGSYTSEGIAKAEARLDETSTPPYAFQRGEHKPIIEEFDIFAVDTCIENYDKDLWERDYNDVVLAWLRYDKSCADVLIGEGLIEQDLGTDSYDKEIKHWITRSYSDENLCNEGCDNSDLADRVDQENWLKSFAFYAVTMNSDTPLVNGNNFYLAMSGAEVNGGWKIVPYDFNLAEVVYCHDDLCNDRLVHWSVARPTCTSLESNNLVGPLLLDEALHAQYIEYVREFVDTVYANQSFVKELEVHAAAQDEFVREDFWALYGAFYDMELTPRSANWKEEIPRFPLLPTMAARTEDVRAQLEAIDTGTYPRGPFVGLHGDNEPWEACPDWRLTEANRSACEEGCMYYGCHMPNWTVPSFCEEESGTCYHGDYDPQCQNVFDDFKYPGLADTEDGRKTFCRFTGGVPVKAIECPAVGAVTPALQSTSSGTRRSWLLRMLFIVNAFVVSVLASMSF